MFAPTFTDSFTNDDVLVCIDVITEAAVGVTCKTVPLEIAEEEDTSLVKNEVVFEEVTGWTEADNNCGVTLISAFSEVVMVEKVDVAAIVVGLCVLSVMDLRMSIEETTIILLCSAVLDCTI